MSCVESEGSFIGFSTAVRGISNLASGSAGGSQGSASSNQRMETEMITIFKYELRITDEQKIDLPKGAIILSVQMQGDTLCLWAMVDTDNKLESRSIAIIETGDPCWCPNWNFIGTIQGPVFVWHVFIEPMAKI